MPELNDGETAQVLDANSDPITLSRRGDVYTCSCDLWTQSHLPEGVRSCLHLANYLGRESEEARLKQAVSGTFSSVSNNPQNLESQFKMLSAQAELLSKQGILPPYLEQLSVKAQKSLKRNKITKNDDDYSAFKKAYALIKMADQLQVLPDLARKCIEQALYMCNTDLIAKSIECNATRANCWLKLARHQIAADEIVCAKQSFENSLQEYEKLLAVKGPYAQQMYARLLMTYASFLKQRFPSEAQAVEEQADRHDAGATPIEFWEEVR